MDNLVARARTLVDNSKVGSNPRNRLYMAGGATEVITELIGEVERLRAERDHHKAVADEYDRLIRHMEPEGDFHEFAAKAGQG